MTRKKKDHCRQDAGGTIKKDLRTSVELFLLKYGNWWGAYTFDPNDWATREEIRKMLDEVPGGNVRDLFKRVRAHEKSKPRLALFDACVEEMKTEVRMCKHEMESKKIVNINRAETLKIEKARKSAYKNYPGDCKICKSRLVFTRREKWVCVMCEVQKSRDRNR